MDTAFGWHDCIEPKNPSMVRRPFTFNTRSSTYLEDYELDRLSRNEARTLAPPFGDLSFTRHPVQ